MAIYNKSTLPVADPISDKDSLITARWRAWFSARQSFDNSIQTRWIRHLTAPITTVDTQTISRTLTESFTLAYPAGSRIMVNDGGTLYKGTVVSCTYDGGTGTVTWVIEMDGGHALSSVSEIYYSCLTSSVID